MAFLYFCNPDVNMSSISSVAVFGCSRLNSFRICEHNIKIYIPQDKYFYMLYMDINTNSEIYMISSWNNILNFLSIEFLH